MTTSETEEPTRVDQPRNDGRHKAVANAAVPGKVEVTPDAIATIAGRAVGESYGVVGLASRHSRPGLAELLRYEDRHRGVQVNFTGDRRVVIELYIIVEYGTRISEVARNVMSNVKFAVESMLGMPVVEVNVNVQGVRVTRP